jgi:hypothetical protein
MFEQPGCQCNPQNGRSSDVEPECDVEPEGHAIALGRSQHLSALVPQLVAPGDSSKSDNMTNCGLRPFYRRLVGPHASWP